MHLEDVPEPSLGDVAGGRGVLVKVIRVGVDGTDKEINEAEYGAAPEGFDYLVTGHESFGEVLDAGPTSGPRSGPAPSSSRPCAGRARAPTTGSGSRT